MFRKTITRLAYSPTLVGELSTYARQLRREKVRRQIGLIFLVLALVVQSFAVLFPPESANAGSTTDFMEGGFDTIDEYLKYYDQDTQDIKDLFTSLGISRTDIQTARITNLEPTPGLLLWKMASRGDRNDTPYTFLKSDGNTKTSYYQPFGPSEAVSSHKASSVTDYVAYVGSSPSVEWFALLKNSGNLVTKTSHSSVSTCASESSLPSSLAALSLKEAEQCHIKLTSTFSAHNLTAGVPAVSRSAQPSDRIMYTLTIKNNDNRIVSILPSVGLEDLLEYSQLIDKGGATFNQETKTLTWTSVTLSPGATLTRNFITKLSPVIPSTATGQNDPASYDCIMSSSFGETLRIPVSCPFPKVIEQITNKLPPLSAQTNLIFAAGLAVITVYFYARSKQLQTELRLIRHNHPGSL